MAEQRIWRRGAAVVVLAIVTLATSLATSSPTRAGAYELTGIVPTSCAPFDGDTFVAATGAPTLASPGGQVTISLAAEHPEGTSEMTYHAEAFEITWPVPSQVVSVDAVEPNQPQGWSLEGWDADLPGGGQPGSLTVAFSGGPGTSFAPDQVGQLADLPAIEVTVTLDPVATDYQLTWHVFSRLALDLETVLGSAELVCTPDDPGLWVNDHTQVGGSITPIHFFDVFPDHPFFAEISWMVDAGLSTGYPDSSFRPAAPVSRQAMVAFLHRSAGSPLVVAEVAFTDVGVLHPMRPAIEWAVATGIASGYPDGTFRPADVVSRQALSAFVHRSFGSPDLPSPAVPSFSDVPVDHPFAAAIGWMAAEHLATGYGDGTFLPANGTSRQAAAAVLFRSR
jgi:hypothetical protein